MVRMLRGYSTCEERNASRGSKSEALCTDENRVVSLSRCARPPSLLDEADQVVC